MSSLAARRSSQKEERPIKQEVFTGYNAKLKPNAQRLRKQATREENHLWYDFLRDYPVQCYRQRVIETFIVDFYCARAKLVIELDGSQHYTSDGMMYDAIRTDILELHSLKVIRFTNRDIWENFPSVSALIDHTVQDRLTLLEA